MKNFLSPNLFRESAQGVRKGDGASIRAEAQARKLQRETGQDYDTKIMKEFSGKKEARQFETETIKEIRKENPNALPGNKGNH